MTASAVLIVDVALGGTVTTASSLDMKCMRHEEVSPTSKFLVIAFSRVPQLATEVRRVSGDDAKRLKALGIENTKLKTLNASSRRSAAEIVSARARWQLVGLRALQRPPLF